MPNTKHTAGEWKVMRFTDGDIQVVVDGGLRKIAVFPWFVHDEAARPSTESNARLIAAAPKMLEALEAIVNEWHSNDTNFEREMQHGAPKHVELARATIKLARGEQ